MAKIVVAFSSFVVGGRTSSKRWKDVRERRQGDRLETAEDHDGFVVGAVLERGTR
jgi:hypothetical protein